MIPLRPEQIGGARVQRAFKFGERRLVHGDTLTGDQVRSIRPTNRSSLVDKGYLMLWPKGQNESVPGAAEVERHVVARGFGRYDVIEGRKLNTEGLLTKEEAYALAGKPMPEDGNGNGAPH